MGVLRFSLCTDIGIQLFKKPRSSYKHSMAMVNPIQLTTVANPNVKDSRWLTLEVCREFQRSKCTRTENECKFAHPPAHVEVQNGRVIACFDSIKVNFFPSFDVQPFKDVVCDL